MAYSIDVAYKSVNHVGEELCGDKVEIVNNDDCRILILADGMGSGIRANILATLTSKILATFTSNKLSVEEIVSTISKTLPISSVNNAAYSTFSMIQAFRDGLIYIVEYDNPNCILIRKNKVFPLPFTYRTIEGKEIRECYLHAEEGDALAIMSDGCIYCGTDDVMNYSWDWKALAQCAEESANRTKTAQQMADRMNGVCYELYGGKPTDDVTVGIVRMVEDKVVNILTGPPSDMKLDCRMVESFMYEPGIKIVSGGSTGNMVARELHTEQRMGGYALDPEIPPTSYIEGIDLVTEGVITLNKCIDLLEQFHAGDVTDEFFIELSKENGATRMACYLMEDCTTVNIYVGRAINEEYTEKSLPFEISARQSLINRLEKVLKDMGRNVVMHYY